MSCRKLTVIAYVICFLAYIFADQKSTLKTAFFVIEAIAIYISGDLVS